MRPICIVLISLIVSCFTFAQSKKVDSLKKLLSAPNDDTTKVDLYLQLADSLYTYDIESAYLYSNQALLLSRKIKSPKRQGKSLMYASDYYASKFNYSKQLSLMFSALQLFESLIDKSEMIACLFKIGHFYRGVEDYTRSISYLHNAYSLAKTHNNSFYMWRSYYILGELYYKLKAPDSALIYFQEAYQIVNRNQSSNIDYIKVWPFYDDYLRGWTFQGLGRAYHLLNDEKLAFSYYYKSLEHANRLNEIGLFVELYQGLSESYFKSRNLDSSIKYSYNSLVLATRYKNNYQIRNAYKQLAKTYEHKNKDSAIKYYRSASILSDSMFGNRNRTELANITYNELDRQRAIVDKERKDAHTRKHNIQYVAIGIGVLTLIILFLLYSRSILGKEKLIKLLGVVVLLIVFEFINLLIHPYLAKATNESPLSMLLVMVGIAALLVPAHHRIEEWVRHQLVEKNKRIRLEAAKKTIQKLEKNS